MDKKSLLKEIRLLKEDFVKNEHQPKSERDVCRVYVEPLFAQLGWNFRDLNEVKEQVNQPDGRPDYIFYLNGSIAFFLETKKVQELTEKDLKQALNYGRSKNKRWAVLSNFKETIILICDIKETSIIKHIFRRIPYSELENRVDDFLLLSRESFQDGILEKKAQDEGRIKKTVKIDDELLNDILSWRQKLIGSIKKNNSKEYSRDELEEMAQILLNRIIFIRTSEDRKHEARPDETIRAILNQYETDKSISIRDRLNKLFREYDEIYDSKLFTYDESNSQKRHECERVEIDSTTYYKILKETYDKNGIYTYQFNNIDADVLGSMYELYIGRIQSTRKEHGIYYTPAYIVDYIVKHTLGEVLKGKTLADAEKIKVLDMACGSGSFLLGAFDVLDEFYKMHDKNYSQSKLDFETEAARTTRKTRILRNNIYGVDLDPKAVEITQLNLLLKAAETKHRLPNLRDNIKCGNSLIDQSLSEKTRAFDWHTQFHQIVDEEKGFNVIIGNPPYVRQEELLPIKPYLEANYEVYHGTADLFVYFFERELKMLKEGGYFGMIVSNKWLKAGYGAPLRKFLNKFWIEQFIDFGDLKVFEDATTYPCIIVIRKLNKPNPKIRVCLVKTLQFGSLENHIRLNGFAFNQKELGESGWNFKNIETTGILEKIKRNTVPLKEYIGGDVYRGILTGLSEAFILDEGTKDQLVKEDKKSAEIIKPFLKGNEVRRYGIEFKNRYLILTKIGVDIKNYPAIFKWLSQYKNALEKRWDKGDYWYELRACAFYELFEKPKLVYGKITTGPRFTIDNRGYLVNDSNFFIPGEDKKLLAILNSKLGWFLIANTCTEIRGGYQLIWKYFGNVPIVKEKSPELEKLADRMLQLNEKLVKIGDKQTDEKANLDKEIAETDAKIDQLVYDLYGLKGKEIEIVDGFNKEKR